jgi:hypothetical protein
LQKRIKNATDVTFYGTPADDSGRGLPGFAHPAMLPMAIWQSFAAKMAWFAAKMRPLNPTTVKPTS